MEIKLAVIGGGSVNWMKALMKDIYLLEEATGGEIRLMDPNLDDALAVGGMLEAMNRIKGRNYRVVVTDDRRKALAGADFVMSTFSPGSMDAFWNDLEIPVKYGIQLPVSMTVGIPGISAALRAVPVAFDLVRDMEELCPDAWLLNVTNPMSAVTRAMNLAAESVRVVGMCHEFHAFGKYIGPMLGLRRPAGMDVLTYLYRWLPEQGFDYTVAGLNHFIWLTRANLNGTDVLPVIREYCRTHEALGVEEWNHGAQATTVYPNTGEVKFALCRQFGLLPLAGDRHLTEFLPSLCNLRNGFASGYNVRKTTVDRRRSLRRDNLESVRRIACGEEEIDWGRSGEEMTEILRAILNGSDTTAIVNMPNQGQIRNLPRGTIVETLATVGRKGMVPKLSGDLPGAVGTLCRLHADIHEMTVQAALAGDRDLLVQAMGLDPSSAGADFRELPALAEELLEANRSWLPRFFQ